MERQHYINTLVALAAEADGDGHTRLATGMLLVARVATLPLAVRRSLCYAGSELVIAAEEASRR